MLGSTIATSGWTRDSLRTRGAHEPSARSARQHIRAKREPNRVTQSIDDLIARTGLRRDELATLADIGALNAFGFDRRSALWQVERAVRPTGDLFDDGEAHGPPPCR